MIEAGKISMIHTERNAKGEIDPDLSVVNQFYFSFSDLMSAMGLKKSCHKEMDRPVFAKTQFDMKILHWLERNLDLIRAAIAEDARNASTGSIDVARAIVAVASLDVGEKQNLVDRLKSLPRDLSKERSSERSKRVYLRIQHLKSQSVRDFNKRVAAEENISITRVKQIFQDALQDMT